MPNAAKQIRLLDAYEELTKRESFCLSEANIDEALLIQDKKAGILSELQKLKEESILTEAEKAEYSTRIEALMQKEKVNEGRLNALMEENRSAYKKITQTSSSVSKVKRAYGSAPQKPRGSGWKGQA